jgi:ribose transport system substrate-binding protein
MTKFKTAGVALAALMLVAACGGPAATPAPTPGGTPATTPGDEGYHIGVSNNGWREEMICSINAQAQVSGDVADLTVAHRNTDAAGQLEDIRNLIAPSVDAIIVNPADPTPSTRRSPRPRRRHRGRRGRPGGHRADDAYIISNNQEEYAYLGAKWLFEQLGGEGTSSTCAAPPARPPTRPRHRVSSARSPSSPASRSWSSRSTPAGTRIRACSRSTTSSPPANFDGIWTSGIDNVIVDALRREPGAAGADRRRRQRRLRRQQLIEVEGLEGAAVTNPASVGGAGVTWRCRSSNGEEPAEQHRAGRAGWCGTTRHRRGHGAARGGQRSGPRSDVAARHPDRGLDDLHQGADPRLRGP